MQCKYTHQTLQAVGSAQSSSTRQRTSYTTCCFGLKFPNLWQFLNPVQNNLALAKVNAHTEQQVNPSSQFTTIHLCNQSVNDQPTANQPTSSCSYIVYHNPLSAALMANLITPCYQPTTDLNGQLLSSVFRAEDCATPRWSDHEFLDNFCTVFVSCVSRQNRKIRVPRLLVTTHVFCLLKTASKCTKTYHFRDKKNDYLGGWAQPPPAHCRPFDASPPPY